METQRLQWQDQPKLTNGRMVLAFTGWMDGGDVSTGTVEFLAEHAEADEIASIDPRGFYLYNFPGSMEVAALFRPHVKIVDGIVEELDFPENVFYCDRGNNLLLFSGKEPNLDWGDFADYIFEVARTTGVKQMYFVGSFGALVPHTREPLLYVTVSDPALKPALAQRGVSFSDYEGPGSFATYLLKRAPDEGVQMASLAAAIPGYIQGTNPKSIEAVVRKLTAMLGLQVRLEEMRPISDEWERRLTEAIKDQDELLQQIRKMEEDYDNEVFDTQMGDLKQWLQQKGIRVD